MAADKLPPYESAGMRRAGRVIRVVGQELVSCRSQRQQTSFRPADHVSRARDTPARRRWWADAAPVTSGLTSSTRSTATARGTAVFGLSLESAWSSSVRRSNHAWCVGPEGPQHRPHSGGSPWRVKKFGAQQSRSCRPLQRSTAGRLPRVEPRRTVMAGLATSDFSLRGATLALAPENNLLETGIAAIITGLLRLSGRTCSEEEPCYDFAG
jgi:hypothetical protein